MNAKEIETQLQDLTTICNNFQESMRLMEKNQREVMRAVNNSRMKGEQLQAAIEKTIITCNTGIQDLEMAIATRKSEATLATKRKTSLIDEQKISHGLTDALESISDQSFQYQGDPKEWPIHKKKLINLIWALGLTKIEAVKIIKMSFTGKALFIAENIDAEDLINQMNGDDNGYEGYLTALGNLFVGKAEADLSRTKFSNATQEKTETIPLYASKILSLFKTAFPDDPNPSMNILVKDKFINGLKDNNQKRFIVERKRKEDPLDSLIEIALKFDAINELVDPDHGIMSGSVIIGSPETGTATLTEINEKMEPNFWEPRIGIHDE